MTVTMDAAGRLVIPKAIREAAGLTAGAPLEVRVVDGRVEIAPRSACYTIRTIEGLEVAVFEPDVPILTAEDLRTLQEELRAR